MAKPQAPAPASPAPKALQTKSAQDAAHLMASVCEIKPEYREAADQVRDQYLAERQHAPVGPMGRKALLADADALASIFAGIDAGATPQQAAAAIGLATETVRNHLQHAAEDAQNGLQTARVAFMAQCQRANERRRQRLLQRIEASSMAGPQYWTAAAWIAERTFGQDYKLQQDTGRGSIVVNVGIVAPGDVRVGGESASTPALEGVIIASDSDKPSD